MQMRQEELVCHYCIEEGDDREMRQEDRETRRYDKDEIRRFPLSNMGFEQEGDFFVTVDHGL